MSETASQTPAETDDLADDPLTRRVIEAIAKAQDMPASQIAVDATFDDMGFDSLDGYEILFALEEAFDVTISDEDAREVVSVREAVRRLRPLVEDAEGET